MECINVIELLLFMVLSFVSEADAIPDLCLMAPDPGPCEAAISRFYYDNSTNKCKCFQYGGCHGNTNNFINLAQCVKTCGGRQKKCLLDKKKGPCRWRINRWFYNKNFASCKPFLYSGCRGNKNRFNSKELCQESCPTSCPVVPKLPNLLKCPNNLPPESLNGQVKFCGRGSQGCSQGYSCVIHPTDRWAICCSQVINSCPMNEEWRYCGNHCADKCYAGLIEPLCTAECQQGCFCQAGYMRRGDGTCITEQACKNSHSCGLHESWMCSSSCREKCYPSQIHVACPEICTEGCFCTQGYVRNINGNCITTQQCHESGTCGAHEAWICSNSCQEKCYPSQTVVDCPEICTEGCFCTQGYVRDKNGNCITSQQCRGEKTCPANEVWSVCGNECMDKCVARLNGLRCGRECVQGCFCKHQFARNQPGKCVPLEECPPVRDCSSLEEYSTCGSRCLESCTAKTGPGKTCSTDCERGCFCKQGLARTEDGDCTLIRLCSKTCSVNEVEICSNDCAESCLARTLGRPCSRQCNQRCFCKKGYARDVDICVPLEECPVCGDNEAFSKCGSWCDEHCNSTEAGCPDACHKGCFCIQGYKRNNQNQCVPRDQCPGVCKSSPARGRLCRKRKVTRWWYNKCTGACEKFKYSGCPGKRGINNNYKTKKRCEDISITI